MGKFLESLRQGAIRPSTNGSVQRTGATVPDVDLQENEEEIPFIEVGPHKSMEASASVLATRSLAAEPMVTFRPSPAEITVRRPHFAPEIIAHHQPDHPVSGQYRDLLAALTHVVSRENVKALLFAPGLPDVDAAAVVLNLAVTAAREGNTRIVAVDADPHQAALAARLGLQTKPGFGEVLSGTVGLDQALQQTDLTNFTVLPAGAPTTPGLRLVVETPGSLLRKLRQCCDLLLVLGPSWSDGCEALAAVCDVVYLVLPEREAGSQRVDELMRTFPQRGARLGGCILTAGCH